MRLYPTALLLGIMNLPAHLSLGAANCTNSVAAVSTADWRTITPPKEDVEVVYTSSYGWVGLNHIYATGQVLKHRRRSLIPWMMPQISTVFPFSRALQAPANRMPLFYVDHLDTAAHIGDLGPHETHLVHLRPRGKDREFEATSGASVFNFDPGFSSHLEIPLKVNTLSNTVFTIQPEQQLADGEYMIVFGPVAASGFEFEINCLREDGPSMPRINVDSRKEDSNPAKP
jgi:hypothetical protein